MKPLKLENQVRDQLRGQVWAQIRGQVRDQVKHQVWVQVKGQVADQVWDQVLDQTYFNLNIRETIYKGPL